MLKVVWVALVGVGWIGLAACGLVDVARYDSKAAPIVGSKVRFPGQLVELDAHAPTVVLFVHPGCPCTKATLHALEEAQAETGNKANVYVVFATPKGLPLGVASQDMLSLARRIGGAHIVQDNGCVEAGRFGATVSGECYVYYPDGTLQFSGGLTRARGHYGSSVGSDALLSLLSHKPSTVHQAPVFGCSLR